MNMVLPAILGVTAIFVAIFLLISDRKNKSTLNTSKSRLTSTSRGSLFVLCLVVIFATLVYYFGS